MNTIFKITAAAIALSASFTASAQKADSKSQSLLDAVAANYKSKRNTYFKFVYGVGKGLVTKTQPGIFYSTPSQYKLKIMGTEQIFDGSRIYSISAEDSEVTIAKPSSSTEMFSPLTYLNSYKKSYNAIYSGKVRLNGIQADVIKLTPVTGNSIKSVKVYLNSAKKQLVKVEQFSTDDSVMVITVKDYKENQPLSPSLFKFDKNNYKNYLITEL